MQGIAAIKLLETTKDIKESKRMGMKEDGPKRPNKKLLYYYGIILLITVLLNALVMPALAERSVT